MNHNLSNLISMTLCELVRDIVLRNPLWRVFCHVMQPAEIQQNLIFFFSWKMQQKMFLIEWVTFGVHLPLPTIILNVDLNS